MADAAAATSAAACDGKNGWSRVPLEPLIGGDGELGGALVRAGGVDAARAAAAGVVLRVVPRIPE